MRKRRGFNRSNKIKRARSGGPSLRGGRGPGGRSARDGDSGGGRGHGPGGGRDTDGARARGGFAGPLFVSEVVGVFEREKYAGYVYPAAKRRGFPLFIPKGKSMKAMSGDNVAARVTKQPRGREPGEGEVTEIISRAGEPGGDMKALARAYGIVPEFPRGALAEAEAAAAAAYEGEASSAHARMEASGCAPGDMEASGCAPGRVPAGAEAVTAKRPRVGVRGGRRDLRGEVVFTIDGADAKDFDDAVSARRAGDGNYLLGVHIADVAHYVREDGELDREALRRGTSVYLPGLTIPMLPEVLSNGICSLNEGVDRLTLTVSMEVDGSGAVVRHEIYESVIRSRARLVYDEVSSFLEGGGSGRAEQGGGPGGRRGVAPNGDLKVDGNESVAPGGEPETDPARPPSPGLTADADVRASLLVMKELADILTAARDARGSIDFDISEAEITLGGDGLPLHIGPRDRRAANLLIEEFMVLANETVAKEYFRAHLPFIYRVHERPDPDRIVELSEFLRGFGLNLGRDPDSVRPMDLAKVLAKVRGRPEENLIAEVVLRSMRKAEYRPDSLGHFGLALRHYCHFTSPIRRYPDLFIHRVIKENLQGYLTARRSRDLRGRAVKAASLSSQTEQAAVFAEREADRAKMTEYMASRVGENFPAVVSGVTSFGVFAELENTIQGLIRMRDLDDDYYEYSEGEYLLRGRLSGREIRLGDRLTVKVRSVDVRDREINFVPE